MKINNIQYSHWDNIFEKTEEISSYSFNGLKNLTHVPSGYIEGEKSYNQSNCNPNKIINVIFIKVKAGGGGV